MTPPPDTPNQLATLRALRDAATDPAQQAALDAAIAALESTSSSATATPVLPEQQPTPAPAPRTTTVSDHAQVGTIVQGDIGGDVTTTIYIHGQRTQSNEQLLAAYLRRVSQRCIGMTMQGVREQKADTDILALSIDQVYTQLATTDLVERENLAGDDLRSLDVEAYMKEHRGAGLVPAQQRTRLHPVGMPAAHEGMREMLAEMSSLSADALRRYAQEAERLISYGPQLVTEAIVQHPHLVLLGEPGSGKSTALRYLAMRLAEAGLHKDLDPATHLDGWATLGEQGRLLPLFVSLLPFSKMFADNPNQPGTADALWNHLARTLESAGSNAGLASAVHEELRAGRVLLLLDGLDEVVGSDSRRRVVDAVQAFARENTTCRIVVSCRVRAYEGEHNQAWNLSGWPTVTLANWTVGQMQHFVQAWYVAAAAASGMSDEKRDAWATKLHSAIARRGDLRRLGVRPLMMTVMALVHFNDGRLPEDRVSLYSRCVDLMLAQWELGKAKEDGSDYGTLMDYVGLPDATVKSLRPLLQQAAAKAHEASTLDSRGSLGRATLKEMVCDTLQQQGHANPYAGAEKFLEYTDVRAGLIQASDAGDAYSFPHLTFQEYLAGLDLVSKVKSVDRILAKRTDDRWRVPILLGIGHLVSEGALSEPYRLLNRLIRMKEERTEEQRQRDLLFAAEIGEDVGWERLIDGDELFVQVQEQLATALVPLLDSTTLPAKERVQAGLHLCTLGDPRRGVLDLPPDMVPIEGGTFIMGSTQAQANQAGIGYERYYLEQGKKDLAKRARTWPNNEINDQPLAVASFDLARYPITNAQYKLFLDDGGYEHDAPWWDDAARAWLKRDDDATEGLEWYQKREYKHQPEFWNDARFGIARPNHPVVGISWYEAMVFCRWLTQHTVYNPHGYIYRLSTEAEWEYAARGTARRAFPWGDEEPDGERANFSKMHGGTTAVGCFSQGTTPQGLHEMAGQVWEWTRSVYKSYPYDPADGREDVDEPATKYFVYRGGSWHHEHRFFLRPSTRINFSPDFNKFNLGLRPARHRA